MPITAREIEYELFSGLAGVIALMFIFYSVSAPEAQSSFFFMMGVFLFVQALILRVIGLMMRT